MKSVKADKREFQPDRAFMARPNTVFVFGSNLSGAHGMGAALDAALNYGAVSGEPFGLQSDESEGGVRSYAIPTKGHSHTGYEPLSYTEVAYWVSQFREWVEGAGHRYDEIFVTKIGCGLAGWNELEIAPLFRRYKWPSNVTLPKGWHK
jgi:hypothetical protein